MQQSHLPIHVVNAELELEELLAATGGGEHATQQQVLAVSRACRVVGVGELFMRGKADRFAASLRLSAEHALLALTQGGPWLTSRIAPLLDAVACGALDLARRMAVAWGTAWVSPDEYEEDHLHAMLLTQYLTGVPAEPGPEAMLDRWQGLVADEPDRRAALWAGLLHKDASAFEPALEDFLGHEEQRLLRLSARSALPPDEQLTTARLSVEGLAFIALGRKEGFALQPDYLMAPSLAQLPLVALF